MGLLEVLRLNTWPIFHDDMFIVSHGVLSQFINCYEIDFLVPLAAGFFSIKSDSIGLLFKKYIYLSEERAWAPLSATLLRFLSH